MLNMGGLEIVVILVVALLVLGPDKLPGLMRTVGKATKELRRASTEFQRTINTEIEDDETRKPIASHSSDSFTPPQAETPGNAKATADASFAAPVDSPAGEPTGTPADEAAAASTFATQETPVTQVAAMESTGKGKLRRVLPVPAQGRSGAGKPLLRKKIASRSDSDGALQSALPSASPDTPSDSSPSTSPGTSPDTSRDIS